MKKHENYIGKVNSIEFPNRGIVHVEKETKHVMVKDVLPGEVIEFTLTKNREELGQGRFIRTIEPSPLMTGRACPYFRSCGGCLYSGFDYDEQLRIKETQVKDLLQEYLEDGVFEGILSSPVISGYRNKMELSFGDEYKSGPLSLGMHKKCSHYDIVTVLGCELMDEDFNAILKYTLDYFSLRGISFYHTNTHEGYLRNLLIRQGKKAGELLVDIVTSSDLSHIKADEERTKDINAPQMVCGVGPDNTDENNIKDINAPQMKCGSGPDRLNEKELLEDFANGLSQLDLKSKIVGILHTVNEAMADVVKDDGTEILFGRDYFYEELLDLRFKVTPFSFFQTNTYGAEILYDKVREYIGDIKGKTIYDLYCGTGTITQILAKVAKRVYGVEIVEEAVEAARENTALNGLSNCEYIAGDVLKVLDDLTGDDKRSQTQENLCHPAELDDFVGTERKSSDETSCYLRPDVIVLDPPREGIHPKALPKIIDFGVNEIIYVSCKPTSLARDMEALSEAGYVIKRACCVDMFPFTGNVETVIMFELCNDKVAR